MRVTSLGHIVHETGIDGDTQARALQSCASRRTSPMGRLTLGEIPKGASRPLSASEKQALDRAMGWQLARPRAREMRSVGYQKVEVALNG